MCVCVILSNQHPAIKFIYSFILNGYFYQSLFDFPSYTKYTKDAFHRYVIQGQKDAVSPNKRGTKIAPYYILEVAPGCSTTIKCRLTAKDEVVKDPFCERSFGAVFEKRRREADEFYKIAIPCRLTDFSCFSSTNDQDYTYNYVF